jgi:cyclic pyranopterin monophosphate synthase
LTNEPDGGGLTHIDPSGEARMVDVSSKEVTARAASAFARVRMSTETISAIRDATLKKGDALGTARIAGIMAAKKTHELIPLCHPLALTDIEVDISLTDSGADINTTVKTRDRTGVEMEALVAASIAALTIYDMCKSIDKGMTVEEVGLVSKSGGKSGDWARDG